MNMTKENTDTIKSIKVLDKGEVALIDYMGNDQAVVEAARISYSSNKQNPSSTDRDLIRYLMRNHHHTPFEMCLHGDTKIPCFYRNGVTAKYYTIKELSDWYEAGGRRLGGIKCILIRTVDKDGTIRPTKIKRVWKSGIKKCYKITEDSLLGRSITLTDNHPILTPNGYKQLKDLRVGDEIYQNGTVSAILNLYDQDVTIKQIAKQIGKRSTYVSEVLEKSGKNLKDKNRRSRLFRNKGIQQRKYTQETVEKMIELWNSGKSTRQIQEILSINETVIYQILKREKIVTKRRTGFFRKEVSEHKDPRAVARRTIKKEQCAVSGVKANEIHHLDKNPHNNELDNLAPLCRKIHRSFHHPNYFPDMIYTRKIKSIDYMGEFEVYDLEIEHENHNFVADGFIVHNCNLKFYVYAPVFIFRQWHRHRTFCLSGDTILSFDLPGGITRRGTQCYKLSIKDIYQKFIPTKSKRKDKQKNPYHKKEKIQKMMLRCVNTDDNTPTHTNITDVWQSGVKKVYQVKLSNGYNIKMSEDHLCYTDKGFLRLKEITNIPDENGKWEKSDNNIKMSVIDTETNVNNHMAVNHDYQLEQWKDVPEWENFYEVSNKGRVRIKKTGLIKINCTKMDGKYHVVSLNRPGLQTTKLVHRLVAESFITKPQSTDKLEVCHTDGNSLNNDYKNLRYDTSENNHGDKKNHNTLKNLKCNFYEITSVIFSGEEQTYDISVKGPYHNFCANGIIVHNSFNEVSGRYSQLPDECYVPDESVVTKQNPDNKQGGTNELVKYSSPLGDLDNTYTWSGNIESEQRNLRKWYEEKLASGMRRELARINLPLSQYSGMYCNVNLRNLFHFLKLRLDHHAQYEIRVYAEAILSIIKPLFPLCVEAFEDYVLSAQFLSKVEQTVLQNTIAEFVTRTDEISNGYHEQILAGLITKHSGNFIANGREHKECIEKLKTILKLQ